MQSSQKWPDFCHFFFLRCNLNAGLLLSLQSCLPYKAHCPHPLEGHAEMFSDLMPVSARQHQFSASSKAVAKYPLHDVTMLTAERKTGSSSRLLTSNVLPSTLTSSLCSVMISPFILLCSCLSIT